jgi:ERCC4-type nuclease
MTITAAMIDSREPIWVQKLSFGNVPTIVAALESGDVRAVTDDGCEIVVERKTPDDFLGTLRDDRLLPQLAHLVEPRINEQINNHMTTWPYLVISGEFQRGPNGKLITSRGQTGWNWDAVQGALLTIQEMGVFVTFCGGDEAFERCIMRLANRKRDPGMKLLPPRPPDILGAGAVFLSGLPGIGAERVMEVLRWAGNKPAHALVGLVDLDIAVPGVPVAIRKKIRQTLGLSDARTLELWINESGDEALKIFEKVGG